MGHHHAALELVTDKATSAYRGSPTDGVGRGATYLIIDLAEKRLAPALAAALYQEDDDSCERRRLRQAELQQQRNVGVAPGRPDKRQRRQLTKFRNL